MEVLKVRGVCAYDKSRGRLYIGEWHGHRVIIIDH